MKFLNFLTADAFNATADVSKTNCLAFALGQTKAEECSYYSIYNLDTVDCDDCCISIGRSFRQKAHAFGLKVHEVQNITEIAGKTAFLVFGWYMHGDFHIVRHNPDGSFEHKPDWKEKSQRVTLEDIFDEYDAEDLHVFVLDED